jgi:hypothetical protein
MAFSAKRTLVSTVPIWPKLIASLKLYGLIAINIPLVLLSLVLIFLLIGFDLFNRDDPDQRG